MASQPIPMDPKYIIDLVVKRRWILLIPFSLAMIVGIYLSFTLPKIYEARTLILIQPQKVPQNYVQSIVTTDPSARINTLSQQILSRSNLEKIIEEFDLFSGPEHEEMYTEDKISSLRENIFVTVSDDKRKESDAFSITYQGENPERVMRITNTLASFFIDENLRLRESQAVGTSDFLDDELLTMKKRLEEVEALLKTYRETYMGELPEQLDSNLRILDRLQEHLNESQQSLGEAKIRLAALQSDAAAGISRTTTVIIDRGQPVTEPTTLDQMKASLESLLARYTENHPDVIRLRALIAETEKKMVASSSQGAGSPDAPDEQDPLTIEYQAQIREINQEIYRLKTDIQETQKQIDLYETRVENTPKREQELLSLKRDYQNIQTTYDSLLGRKLEAEIALNMERKQKGEQFWVLDPASLPEKPVKPNMRKLLMMVVGAGLAVGGGIVFLLEFMSNSFKRPEDIEEDLQVPVLCTIPKIIDRKTRILKRFEYVFCALFCLICCVLLAGFTLFSLHGVEPTLEIVRTIVNV